MNLRINSINFRGYDAAPLKRIYIEQEYSAPFADELKAVGMTEDIKVATIHDNLEWVQDDKSIIEKAGGPFLISSDKASDNFLCTIRSRYKMPATRTPGYLTGGNAFIGKFPKKRIKRKTKKRFQKQMIFRRRIFIFCRSKITILICFCALSAIRLFL